MHKLQKKNKLQNRHHLMLRVLQDLTLREQRILRLRFISGKTQEQVANLYGLTKERIRQVEDIALKRINAILDKLKKEL